jgi:signal transduction histidine kinase
VKANNQGFHCEVIKKFDESLPQANVIPQEISRVVLNLLNNAFFAVKDKAMAKVEILTHFLPSKNNFGNGTFNIIVRDNGVGIPDDIKQKIFEPFFTTKPTGFGNTGLGLSISFDIIKAHSGNITFSSKVGEGSEFVVSLQV